MARSDVESVLVAGGGVAALEATLALRELLGSRLRIELLAPEPLFWYRPVAVAEPFGLGEVRRFELSAFAARTDASFTLGSLRAVDAQRREVRTAAGATIPYDALLLACGAVPTPTIPGALTFRGPADVAALKHVLEEAETGLVKSLAFVVPRGAAWQLPAYELALLFATRLRARGVRGVELALVTPEPAPLELFGTPASQLVRELLEERDVVLHTGCYATEATGGELRLVPDRSIPAGRVVALPRLVGPRLDGVPQTVDGFVPIDPHCHVPGVQRLFAAGDVTSYPVKQGGIAAQQAQAAAEAIAALVDTDIAPHPFRPVLRGLLLTGAAPRYLRNAPGSVKDLAWASETPLWWPPTKIVGRHLPRFLADTAGVEPWSEQPADAGVPVEVELEVHGVDHVVARPRLPVEDRERRGGENGDALLSARDLMSPHPLVVGGDETLSTIAAAMMDEDVGSALVADSGRLVGILTSRDLIRALAAGAEPGVTLVRTWMTAEPVAVEPDTRLDELERLMSEIGVHHLPVVDEGRPIGIVGLRDVTRASRPHALGLGF